MSAYVAALAAFAFLSVDPARIEPTPIDPPALAGAKSPAIATEGATTITKEHEILLTWLEPGGQLRFARYSEQDWSRPITVAQPVSLLEPADRPSLTVLDTQAVRRTLIARTGDTVARSGNAGRTWGRLPSPALPFASFAGGDEGGYAFWLAAGGAGEATLLGTRVLAGETVLDPQAIYGFGTAAAMTWDGPVVVYGGHRTQGSLDLAVVRRHEARWTSPRSLHRQAGSGPVAKLASGPRVAAQHRQVAVAWTTMEASRNQVYVAFSSDAGKSFGNPVRVAVGEGEQRPAGPVDLALDEQGTAFVLWLAGKAPGAARLELARVFPSGGRSEALTLARGLSSQPESPPQIVLAGSRLAVTWVEGRPSRVRAVEVPLTAIPAARLGQQDGIAASNKKPRIYSPRGLVGESVPDLELRTLEGDAVSLASLAGRPVLLNLWATWCLPCRAEMPELALLHERYGPQGLVVLGLSVDDSEAEERVHAYVAERQLPFTIWLDPEMGLYQTFRVRSLPTTFLIDRGGRISWRWDGTITAEDPELLEALGRVMGGS